MGYGGGESCIRSKRVDLLIAVGAGRAGKVLSSRTERHSSPANSRMAVCHRAPQPYRIQIKPIVRSEA